MIIHSPEIFIEGEHATLKSRVEWHSLPSHIPEMAWFRYPAEHSKHLSEGSEMFAAALIQTAMFYGEDLEVRGAVTPRFAFGLHEYHNAFHAWFPALFKEIDIRFENTVSNQRDVEPSGIGLAFSGGIDSTYTLIRNLPDNQPLTDYQVQYGLFLQGMDYSLDDGAAFEMASTRYQELFDRLGLHLIPVQSNVTAFTKYRIDLALTFGGPLIAAGLGLEKLLKRFYIASSFTYDQLQPVGSGPIVDPLLGTETMDIVHHGAAVRRFDKLREVVRWGGAKDTLRVCIRDPKPLDHLNCSHCGKCLQVMAQLELMGKQDDYSVLEDFELGSFITWGFHDPLSRQTNGELIHQSRKAGRWVIYLGMYWVKVSSWLRLRFDRLARYLLRGERLYRFKRWYFGRERKDEANPTPSK